MAHRAEPAPDIYGLGDYTSVRKENRDGTDEPPAEVLEHLRSRR